MGKNSPSFQFYPNDWLGSSKIMLMTPAQEGAYIRLLAIAWNSPDCSLPADDRELAVLSRLNEGWLNGGSEAIKKCFKERNGKLYNDRLLLEKKKQAEWRKKSSEGGKASAKSRWANKLDKPDKDKGGYKMVTDCLQPNGNSSSSLSSSLSSSKNIPPIVPQEGQSKRFIKPTPEQAQEYAKSIDFPLDGSAFCDYYQARGWEYKRGQPVKDWKAAIRTWKKHKAERDKPQQYGPSLR